MVPAERKQRRESALVRIKEMELEAGTLTEDAVNQELERLGIRVISRPNLYQRRTKNNTSAENARGNRGNVTNVVKVYVVSI